MFRKKQTREERTNVIPQQKRKPNERFQIERLEDRIAPTHTGLSRACDITGGRVCENLARR